MPAMAVASTLLALGFGSYQVDGPLMGNSVAGQGPDCTRCKVWLRGDGFGVLGAPITGCQGAFWDDKHNFKLDEASASDFGNPSADGEESYAWNDDNKAKYLVIQDCPAGLSIEVCEDDLSTGKDGMYFKVQKGGTGLELRGGTKFLDDVEINSDILFSTVELHQDTKSKTGTCKDCKATMLEPSDTSVETCSSTYGWCDSGSQKYLHYVVEVRLPHDYEDDVKGVFVAPPLKGSSSNRDGVKSICAVL